MLISARAGVILDPFWRDQADQCQWVEDWDWQYEREFDVPQEFALDWNVLEFSGLDTYATIELNGQEIAKTSNMSCHTVLTSPGSSRPAQTN